MQIMENLNTRLKIATRNTLKSLVMIIPMILAVIGLVGLFETFITTQKCYHYVFDCIHTL